MLNRILTSVLIFIGIMASAEPSLGTTSVMLGANYFGLTGSGDTGPYELNIAGYSAKHFMGEVSLLAHIITPTNDNKLSSRTVPNAIGSFIFAVKYYFSENCVGPNIGAGAWIADRYIDSTNQNTDSGPILIIGQDWLLFNLAKVSFEARCPVSFPYWGGTLNAHPTVNILAGLRF
ncbi:MAG: hypothetical protein M0001_14080 [Treponema sp.]|nr:hypothetical protein [Treponema sp.]